MLTMFLCLQIQHMKPFHSYSWEGASLCLTGAPISPIISSSATRTQTMTPSQCYIVHSTLSSYGLIPLTLMWDSCSNSGPHKKKAPASFCICDAKTSMAGYIMVLTGKVALCQSQRKSSGFTSGKQLKDQAAFNTSGSWERAQEGPNFLLFLDF